MIKWQKSFFESLYDLKHWAQKSDLTLTFEHET